MSGTQVRDDGPRPLQDGGPISTFAARVLDVLVDRSRGTSLVPRRDLVFALAEGMVRQDDARLEVTMRDFRRACISPAAMAEVYVPAAARLLGSEWAADSMCFADVTIGAARLQALVRAIGTRWGGDRTHIPGRRSILMLVPECEDHTLGAVVATGKLRQMGFSVCLRLGPTTREVGQMLRARVFDAAMLSIGSGDRLAHSRRLVETLRVFGPKKMPVVVGGASMMSAAELKVAMGVDLVSSDLTEALAFCGFGAADLDDDRAVPLAARRRI